MDKKQLLREHLNKHNISKVNYLELDNFSKAKDWFNYPCIVKPVDSQGQRGVYKINRKEDLKNAVIKAIDISKSKVAIIEDYLEGIEISCNVLIKNGEFIFDILSERLVHEGNLIGIPKGHLIPCKNVDLKDQKNAIELVHKTINSLKVDNGCLYFQMKVTDKGIKIIEIAPRLDGCHMWRLIKAATDRDFLASTVDCLLDNFQNEKRVILKDNFKYELIFQQDPPNKIFYSKNYTLPNDSIYQEFRYNEGEKINPTNGRLEVVGYYVRKYG